MTALESDWNMEESWWAIPFLSSPELGWGPIIQEELSSGTGITVAVQELRLILHHLPLILAQHRHNFTISAEATIDQPEGNPHA